MIGVFYYLGNKNTNTEEQQLPWYKQFNPFYNQNVPTNGTQTNNDGAQNQADGVQNVNTSRFNKITDYAISGATYFEDRKPIITDDSNTPLTTEVKTIISPDTKSGRQEIQAFLNDSLSLKTPLIVDGNFGNATANAIKDFQKLNNLTITGKIDAKTSVYFTKTTTETTKAQIQYEVIPSVKYVERKNGHIHQTNLDTKTVSEISITTIPSIYEAFFDGTTQSVLYRYLETGTNTIISFLATLGSPKGEFLPPDVLNISVSPDQSQMFYMTKNANGITGAIKPFINNKISNIFNSPYTEWLSQWATNDQIFLTTKPYSGTSGSVFNLNVNNGTMLKVFGGIDGLTTLVNNKGSLILYNATTSKGPKLNIFDVNKYKSSDLNIYGLPEKCVWMDSVNVYCAIPSVITGTQYPEAWYQGLISFDDYFVQINTNTGSVSTIINSIDETPVDAINLFFDNSKSKLFFTNKKDYTLWSLDL